MNERMVNKQRNPWMLRLQGFAAAILLGGITVGILAICGVFDSGDRNVLSEAPLSAHEETTQAAEPKAQQDPEKSQKELEEAIAYIEHNDHWNRSDMESYPLLQGLFDDINTFNFVRIRDFWLKRFKSSQRFAELERTTSLCITDEGFDDSETVSTYNDPDNETISISEYIRALNP